MNPPEQWCEPIRKAVINQRIAATIYGENAADYLSGLENTIEQIQSDAKSEGMKMAAEMLKLLGEDIDEYLKSELPVECYGIDIRNKFQKEYEAILTIVESLKTI